MPSLIAAVMPGAAGTAFETWPAAAGASATIGTSSAAIRASASAVAATVASVAAERPLEARTRVAANAGGVARKIFTRSGWAATSRGTSFAGKENHVVFDDRRAFSNGFAKGCRDRFLFDKPDLGVFVLDLFMLAVLVLALGCVVLGVLLSHVRSKFRPVGRASRFDLLSFFLGEFRNFSGRRFFSFFYFFFVKFGAADDRIGFRFFLCLFVFGLDETGSECGDLIFV
jgi:hypothetical protein